MKNRIFSQFRTSGILMASIIGMIYSGILAYGKLTTGVCSFGSVCPYLFGLPVCIFGFFGFLAITILMMLVVFVKMRNIQMIAEGLFWFSLAGTLFALYYLIQELFFLPGSENSALKFGLGYPSCLYGFILFGTVFSFVRYALTHTED